MTRPPLKLVEPSPEPVADGKGYVTVPTRIRARAEAFVSDADRVRRALLTGSFTTERQLADAVALMERKR